MHRRNPVMNTWRLRSATIVPVLLLCGVFSAFVTGCGSLGSLTNRKAVDRKLDKDPNLNIAGIQGPAERSLSASRWKKTREELSQSGDETTLAALTAYDHAEQLYDDEQYAQAEKAFKKLVKERRDLYESFGARFRRAWGVDAKHAPDPYSTYGDPIEEDALVMLADCQFAQGKYATAQNTYDELLVRYPSTRHLDHTSRQLFRIARYWLNIPGTELSGDGGDVHLAQGESSSAMAPKRQPSALDRVPVLPNLTDKSRPLFDTYGRGKQALRSIWLHDATGPLADDALMLSATHSLFTSDYVEAKRLYALLREQYPDSPHVKDAFLLGSHVALASYQGAPYDGEALENSRQLKQATLQLFPDLSPEQRQQLEEEVDKLVEDEVARIWDIVEFYRAKKSDPSIALHCYLIINKYPESRYAEMARQELRAIEERKATKQDSSWAWLPGGGQKTQSVPQQQAPQRSTPAESAEPEQFNPPKDNLLQRLNPLRKSEKPPQLQPIGEDLESEDNYRNRRPETASYP